MSGCPAGHLGVLHLAHAVAALLLASAFERGPARQRGVVGWATAGGIAHLGAAPCVAVENRCTSFLPYLLIAQGLGAPPPVLPVAMDARFGLSKLEEQVTVFDCQPDAKPLINRDQLISVGVGRVWSKTNLST